MTVGTNELRADHGRILDLAGDLRAAVETEGSNRPVATLRWRLARALMTHLALEDRFFYPALARGGDDRTARLGSQFQDEMGDLAAAFAAYLARWSENRVAANWPTFREETLSVLDALERRIARENEALYPLLESRAA